MPHDLLKSHEVRLGWALAASVVAVLGILCPVPSFVELYNFPPHSAIRPMGQVAAMFLAGIGTPLVVVPCAIQAFRIVGTSRWLGIFAAAVSLLPLPLYWFLFHLIIAAHHLSINP